MNWVLPFDWNPQTDRKIIPSSHLFFMGSCFAENIAHILLKDRFHVGLNPFGILYNPVSMAKSFEYCLHKTQFEENNLFHFNELWHSELHHSSFSDMNKELVVEKINTAISEAHRHIQQCDFIFLTSGTAKVFCSKKTNQIVGNCHKRPAADFSERVLDVGEIAEAWANLFSLCPDKVFYVSISPVRYVREGLVESNHSKAVLRVALMQLAERFPNVHYFPAYELITDVLRDYRFYANDLVHPNQQAIDFVYDFFMDKLFDPLAKDYVKEWRKVDAMLNHKALNPTSAQWNEFEKKRNLSLTAFKQKWNL